MKKLNLLFAAIVLLALHASAQTDSTQSNVLNTIIVKAMRASDNAPFTKTTITAQQLKINNTGVDLPILLNNVANVVTNSDAGTGVGYTGIRLRGSDISRINVTLNGVPVNDAEGQGVFFVNFADVASSAQSIQIQRGVGSSTNGAGAFGGSIHINSIDLPIAKKVMLQLDASSQNTWRQTIITSSGLQKNKYCITTRLSNITSDGYIDRSASKLRSMQVTAGYYPNSKTSIVLNYMGGGEKTQQAWGGVSAQNIISNRTYNELGLKADSTFYDNQTDNYWQHYFQLLYNKQLKNNWKLNITPYYTRGFGYYQEYKVQDALANYGIDNIIISIDTISNADIVRQLWLSNHLIGAIGTAIGSFSNTSITLGASANTYFGNHYGIVKQVVNTILPEKKFYDLHSIKSDRSTFVKAEYKANQQLLLYADVQYRYVNYATDGFRNSPKLAKQLFYNFINPKLGLQYTMPAQNNTVQKIYASYGLAQKEPNRDDIEAASNKEPLPEMLNNIEVGYTAKNAKHQLQTNVYYMRYTNQLVQTGKVNSVGAYTRENVLQSFRAGLEVEANTTIVDKIVLLNTNASISTNKINNVTEYVDDYDNGTQLQINHSNTTISFSPSVVASATVSILPIAKKALHVDIINKYVGKQYLDNTSNESRIIKAFGTTDVLANYAFTIGKTQLNTRIGVYNIWNNKYQNNGYTFSYIAGGTTTTSNYYYPQAGTRFTAGFSVQL
jgi:iron complex outermembrane recepter protein